MPESSLRDTFGDYIVTFGKQNKNIVVLDADLSSSTRTSKFAKIFPDRFFNMGIAEQNMLGTALGFAISGKIPIVSGFSIFTTGRAWEFIRSACHDKLNIKIITTHGGIIGEDGSSHNALEDLSLMATLPNIQIFIPADKFELIKILEYSIKEQGPTYIRLPRGNFPEVHDESYEFRVGKPELIKEGEDICLIGTGFGTCLAVKLVSELEKELKISIRIVNLPSIKPIDEKLLIDVINDMKGIITIEEHNIYCGFGSIISRLVSDQFPIRIKTIGFKNTFGQSGKREILLDKYGLNKKTISNKIREIID
ncbi:MAG: transketolase family protein [Candidatus Thorarchaeota archaeon]